MKNEILANLDKPGQLEKLYRTNKSSFRQAFNELLPELNGNAVTDCWNERLNYEEGDMNWGTGKDLLFVVVASLLAGLIAKLPAIFGINEEAFYLKNLGFVVFPFLAAWFAWKNRLPAGKIVIIAGILLACVIFINLLPGAPETDTVVLSCLHLIVLLWALTGFAFAANNLSRAGGRLNYLRYNGDLVVMTTLILIAGGLLTAITFNLFELIGLRIQTFYRQYVVIFGLPAAPILATYLTQTNPQLVGKVSPVIARIFSPLVLVMLSLYLFAMLFSGKDPYNDREFLLIFNALLLGVMAIIFFSVAESSQATKTRWEKWILFLLSIMTIIVNGIALSAILFRISAWGITPNRTAVLGANILILLNLVLVTVKLFRVVSKQEDVSAVGKVIAAYLPIYIAWAAVVTFLFPFLFGFR